MRGLRVNVLGALALMVLLTGIAVAPDSPVADAAMRGDVEMLQSLIKQGADVNLAQGDGMTALHWAAERGSLEMAELLIRAGGNVRAGTRIGSYTPLHLASKAGSVRVVQALLAAGSDANAATTNNGGTPLHFAAGSGSAEVVAALLDHGADANAREGSEWGQTPLMFAAANNGAAAIKVLLERGADPSIASRAIEDVPGRAAVDIESVVRRSQVLRALRGRGQAAPAQVQEAIRAGREFQLSATTAEYTPETDEYGRGIDVVGGIPTLVGSWGGLTPLLHAARQGHVEAALALLDGGADIDEVSGDGTSPLLIATLNGRFDLALLLIERGADPNVASDVGTTPLYAAIQTQWAPKSANPQPRAHELQKSDYLNVLEALLKAGANPNVRLKTHLWYFEYTFNLMDVDLEGSTPFWRAAYATDVEAMRILAAYGADPTIPTVLSAFDRNQSGEVTVRQSELLEQKREDATGLPPVPVGGPAVYPIHAASGVGYGVGRAANHHRHAPDGWVPSVKFLVDELGADVNARDQLGYTALHHAASRGDVDLILYLVSKGADVPAIARSGETTADMANGPHPRGQVYPEAIKLLEALGSKFHAWCGAGASPSTCIRG